MASNWIKLEVITPDKPEIFRLAEILNIDPDAALGKVIRFWVWADQQMIDGNAECNARGVTKSAIDRITFMVGFADALIQVGWLVETNGVLSLPNFERHNGKSSKKRAVTNERVTKIRELKRKGNAASVTQTDQKALPEEEEEEDINTDLTHPKPFPSGREFRDFVAGVLEGRLSGGTAAEFCNSAVAALQAAGLDVCREYPVPERGDGCGGRIDIVVTDRNGVRCGIELDRNSPRQKSLLKIGAVETGICVLRRSDIARHTEQGILVIGGAVRQKKFDPLSVALPDWLPETLWHEWVQFRQALRKPIRTEQGANGAIRELEKFRQQGFSPEQVIRHSIANEYQGLFAPKGVRPETLLRQVNTVSLPDSAIPPGFRG
ncbi:phage protein [Escherichia coli]|nr:phage protein [Escherichia coli]